jgi:hypothetical protein
MEIIKQELELEQEQEQLEQEQEQQEQEQDIVKKKRGRRSKKEIELLNKQREENLLNGILELQPPTEETKHKKRGRKPKGGKIVEVAQLEKNIVNIKSNVILHLKCFLKDIDETNNISKYESISTSNSKLLFSSIDSNHIDELNAFHDPVENNDLNNNNHHPIVTDNDGIETISNNNNILPPSTIQKLKELEIILKHDLTNDKKSCCFYCTESFDNIPIRIPKYILNGYIYVYGCFCQPECGVGFLMNNELLMSSVKFERLSLMNYVYGKIFNYEYNIKPSPNPYYTLDKFLGNLPIKEYRKLAKSNQFFVVIDKPITRSLPELHNDNDDCIIANKKIPSNNKNNSSSSFLEKKTNQYGIEPFVGN